MVATAADMMNTTTGADHPGFFVPGDQPGGGAAPSLVKGTKSPTGQKTRIFDLLGHGGEIVGELADRYRVANVRSDGTCARLSFREWSGEWRLRCHAEIPPSTKPPENTGDRVTHRLSDRGARALGESCEFVTVKRGGYTTFLTLTLDAAARSRIESRKVEPVGKRSTWEAGDGLAGDYCAGERAGGAFCRVRFPWASSIQREASRFFDALQKMHARGWVPAYRRGRVQRRDGAEFVPIEWNTRGDRIGPDGAPFCMVEGCKSLDSPLDYLWVAENPINEEGERNPHIHVLLRWRVPFALFPCWAHRIEKLWGQGFAHLEKLKNAEASGYYIAKAAGYLTKANGESDQGPVRGNRYGIARSARAPGWVPVLVMAWGVLGHLIEDAREIWREKVGPLKAARDKLAAKLKDTPKEQKTARQKIARALMRARETVKAVPAWFGRFSCVFKGNEAAGRFIKWAERRGWSMDDEKPDGRWFGEWKRQRAAAEEAKRRRLTQWAHDLGDWLGFLRQYDGWMMPGEEYEAADWAATPAAPVSCVPQELTASERAQVFERAGVSDPWVMRA